MNEYTYYCMNTNDLEICKHNSNEISYNALVKLGLPIKASSVHDMIRLYLDEIGVIRKFMYLDLKYCIPELSDSVYMFSSFINLPYTNQDDLFSLQEKRGNLTNFNSKTRIDTQYPERN